MLQPLPIDEQEANPSMGYGGADLFSPDFPYVASAADVHRLAPRIDAILAEKGFTSLPPDTLLSAQNQIKVLVDLCHIHGIAVVFDVVYNHAGGFSIGNVGDDHCLYYFDRERNVGNNNDSLYFTDQDRGTGGLAFAMWKMPVRRFLQENARWYAEELHADGLRYDEITILLSANQTNGWEFCRELTTGLRSRWPRFSAERGVLARRVRRSAELRIADRRASHRGRRRLRRRAARLSPQRDSRRNPGRVGRRKRGIADEQRRGFPLPPITPGGR